MPTYEYECTQCRFRFERRQRFDEEPVASCPQCGGKGRRLLHSIPVIFKGSGFYSTDNRKSETSEGPKEKGKEAKEPKAAKAPEASPAS